MLSGSVADPVEKAQPESHRRLSASALWLAMRAVALAFVVAATLWGTLAIYYSNLPLSLRPWAAVLFVGTTLGVFLMLKPRRLRLPASVALFAAVLTWWLLIPPSNSRQWQPDLATLAWAELDGSRLTVHNIRNCSYRSETDFDVRCYDRTFDLDKLRSVDLFHVYWGSPHIAHTMLSFGFEGDRYLCFSIETRKEVGEDYSAIKGLFKQYELIYVVADERDLVRLRTNYRHEEVHLYRLKTTHEIARKVLLDYFRAVNSLRDRPEWYNALTSNCTTNIRGHTLPHAGVQRSWNWRLLLNGHLDELSYARGGMDTSLPFAEMKSRSIINERAMAAEDTEGFSQRIREGLPGMQWTFTPAGH